MTEEEIQQKLAELYSIIQELGSKIAAPKDWLPAPKGGQEASHSWLAIEFREGDDGDDEDGYWLFVVSDCDGPWVCTAECFVQYSDDLLRTLFEGITHNIAMARRHPAAGEDPRRSLFRIQVELLAQLNPDWATKTATRHAQLLRALPFSDH